MMLSWRGNAKARDVAVGSHPETQHLMKCLGSMIASLVHVTGMHLEIDCFDSLE